MSSRKGLRKISEYDQESKVHPRSFVFFDKKTGTRRFEVGANEDGSLPAGQVTSLLAVYCMLHGKIPVDFDVLVAVKGDLLNGLGKRAEKLIRDCQIFQSSIVLSVRQKQVLRELLKDLSNKEIAWKMHLSVRTVKFHMSALLEKFGVADRISLIRKATDLISAGWISAEAVIPKMAWDAGIAKGKRVGDRWTHAYGLERRSRG